MMYQLNMADLRRLDEDQRSESLSALAHAARTNGEAGAQITKSRIAQFEARYEMTSAQLLEGLSEGAVRETAEVAEWLFLLRSAQGYVAV